MADTTRAASGWTEVPCELCKRPVLVEEALVPQARVVCPECRDAEIEEVVERMWDHAEARVEDQAVRR